MVLIKVQCSNILLRQVFYWLGYREMWMKYYCFASVMSPHWCMTTEKLSKNPRLLNVNHLSHFIKRLNVLEQTSCTRLTKRNEVSEQMFPTVPSRSPEGAFCNPVPKQTCIFTTGLLTVKQWLMWQLDQPSDTLWLKLGGSCWARRPWQGWTGVLWRRNRTWPVLPWQSIQGSPPFLTLSPLKNSPHFSPAKAKQTGHCKGFYF